MISAATAAMLSPSLTSTFWRKVRKAAAHECWLWTGATNHNGYGHLRRGRKSWRAHRLSYLISKGDIPDSLVVMHKCDVRLCVNPSHLQIGTRAENNRDMASKGRLVTWMVKKPACAQGHPWTSETTMKGRSGARKCRICSNEWRRRRLAADRGSHDAR